MVFFLLGPINPLEGLLGVLVCVPPPPELMWEFPFLTQSQVMSIMALWEQLTILTPVWVDLHAARMNTDFRAPHHLLLKRTWAMSLNGTALIDKNKDSQGIVSKERREG